MAKSDLANLTNAEVEDASKKSVLVLALGTVESNGPHQLLGIDYLLAENVAVHACRRAANALRAPSFAYGVSYSQEGKPGTFSIDAELLSNVVTGIVEAAVRNGFQKILLINCHRGNNATIEDLARRFRREGSAVVATIDPIDLGKRGPFAGAESSTTGHGGEPGMSMMMHLYPEDVRLDLAPGPGLTKVAGVQAISSQHIAFRGARAGFFLTSAELNPAGAWADVSGSTAEKGAEAFEWIVNYTVAFIDWLAATPIKELNPKIRGFEPDWIS